MDAVFHVSRDPISGWRMRPVDNATDAPIGTEVAVYFWDRHIRSWTIFAQDGEGNQITDARHVYSKREAILEARWIAEDIARKAGARFTPVRPAAHDPE